MTASEKRRYAAELMRSRKGLNSYTQGAKRAYFFGYPDNKAGDTKQKGYSDCSSAVRAAIKAAAGIDIGSNTSAQVANRKKGLIVHQTDGYYPDESKLKPGDCLYFKGNSSHTLDVGHVEMYVGDGKCCGHGSGTGPKVRDMMDYCKSRASNSKRYFMAIRWIKDDEVSDTDEEKRSSLKNGMEGDDVAALQRALLELGYSVGSYGIDGEFGTATENAVRAFQEAEGLLVTGIADEDTLRAIARLMEQQSDSGDDDTTDTPAVPIANAVEIASGRWNVRTGPGKEFASAGIVRGGDKLEKLDTDGWIPVMYNGEVRWISPSAAKE